MVVLGLMVTGSVEIQTCPLILDKMGVYVHTLPAHKSSYTLYMHMQIIGMRNCVQIVVGTTVQVTPP